MWPKWAVKVTLLRRIYININPSKYTNFNPKKYPNKYPNKFWTFYYRYGMFKKTPAFWGLCLIPQIGWPFFLSLSRNTLCWYWVSGRFVGCASASLFAALNLGAHRVTQTYKGNTTTRQPSPFAFVYPKVTPPLTNFVIYPLWWFFAS